MVDAPSSHVDKVETAANIYVRISVNDLSFEIPVSEVDRTKEVDAERVREMGLYPDGYAINGIDVDGSLSFAGNVVRTPQGSTKNLDELLFDDDGVPRTFDITIAHEDPMATDTEATTESIMHCIVTSSQFSSSSGDTTESSYDFLAQRLA